MDGRLEAATDYGESGLAILAMLGIELYNRSWRMYRWFGKRTE